MFLRHNVDLVGDISQLADLFNGTLINNTQPNLSKPLKSSKSLEPVS
jgi:hypothetical protein